MRGWLKGRVPFFNMELFNRNILLLFFMAILVTFLASNYTPGNVTGKVVYEGNYNFEQVSSSEVLKAIEALPPETIVINSVSLISYKFIKDFPELSKMRAELLLELESRGFYRYMPVREIRNDEHLWIIFKEIFVESFSYEGNLNREIFLESDPTRQEIIPEQEIKEDYPPIETSEINAGANQCESEEVCVTLNGYTTPTSGESEAAEKERAKKELSNEISSTNPSSLCKPSIPPCSPGEPYLKKHPGSNSYQVSWLYCVQCKGGSSGSGGDTKSPGTTTTNSCPASKNIYDGGVYKENLMVSYAEGARNGDLAIEVASKKFASQVSSCNTDSSLEGSLIPQCSRYCTANNKQCGSKIEGSGHSCSVKCDPHGTSGRTYKCRIEWDSHAKCSCPESGGNSNSNSADASLGSSSGSDSSVWSSITSFFRRVF